MPKHIEYGAKKPQPQTDTSQKRSASNIEQALLKLFESDDAEKQRQKILATNPSWEEKLHLSYARENLLNWFPLKPGSRLLELTPGYGALTGLFLRSCDQVDVLTTSTKQAEIIRKRYETSNLQLIKGTELATAKGSYDYVVLFGFQDKPVEQLTFAKQLLKPDRTLVFAVDNRLAIKYWAGTPDVYSDEIFAGIEGVSDTQSLKKVGKGELDSLLDKVGFETIEYYYPFPDHLLPLDIYSDQYSPETDDTLSSDLFPTPAQGKSREYLFAEDLAMGSIAANGLFPYFANAFLVFATREKS